MGKKFNLKETLKNDVQNDYNNRDNFGVRGENYLENTENLSFFKVTKGYNMIDVIPFIHSTDMFKGKSKGDPNYNLTVYVHRYFNQGGDKVICPQSTFNKPCPICMEAARLRELDADEYEDRIKQLRPSKRLLMNVINLREDDEDENNGQIQVFDQSYALFAKPFLEEACDTEDGDMIDFVSPDEDGKSVKFKAHTKKLGKNTFFTFDSFSFEERDDTYSEDILDADYSNKVLSHGAFSLDGLLKVLSFEDLEALLADEAFDASNDDDEDDSEEDEKMEVPRNRKSKSETRREAIQKDEEHAEGEEDEEEENKCPFGHVFGEENMEHDDCLECKKNHKNTFKECVVASM